MKINLYQNLKSPTVSQSINIHEWFDQIKNSKHSKLIQSARFFGKGSNGYESIKTNLIPCVTLNFLFKDKKTNANILDSTGFLYFDIDNSSFLPNNAIKSKIFAMYRSFGGKGWAVIVKVEGLTIQNYSETFDFIAKDLEIEQYLDKGAKKATQYSVLSYDPNIYLNNTPFLYSSKVKNDPLGNTNSLLINKREKKEKHIHLTKGVIFDNDINFLKLSNVPDLCNGEKFVVLDNSDDVIKCFEPYFKLRTGRNNLLLSYCTNLVYLNPGLTKQRAVDSLKTLNHIVFDNPVQNDQILRVVNSVFKQSEMNLLKPNHFKSNQKIFFNENIKLSRQEKRKIVGEICGERKINKSIETLGEIIRNWDKERFGKISTRKISLNFKINKKAVDKHYKLFAEEIKLKK